MITLYQTWSNEIRQKSKVIIKGGLGDYPTLTIADSNAERIIQILENREYMDSLYAKLVGIKAELYN